MSYTLTIQHNNVCVEYYPVVSLVDVHQIADRHSFYLWNQEFCERNNDIDVMEIETYIFDKKGRIVLSPTMEIILENVLLIADDEDRFEQDLDPELDQIIIKAVKSQLRRARKLRYVSVDPDQREARREHDNQKAAKAAKAAKKAKEAKEAKAAKEAKNLLHEEAKQSYYDIKDVIPYTQYQERLYVAYENFKEKYPNSEDRPEGWYPAIPKNLIEKYASEFDRDVVLIQVATSITGYGAGIFVPVDIIDQNIDSISLYTGDKFTLNDIFALFNIYFRDKGLDPGFYVNADRDGLRLKMLAEYDPRRGFRITQQGREFVESLLKFHSTVFRPMRYEDMYYSTHDGIVRKDARPRRELRKNELSSSEMSTAHLYPCAIDVRDYMRPEED